jgi:hypothetical protein
MALIDSLRYGTCAHCRHEIASREDGPDRRWTHYITRSERKGLAHRPAGHILTAASR